MCDFFFFNDTATTEIYTLSLHDALPISQDASRDRLLASIRRRKPQPVTRPHLLQRESDPHYRRRSASKPRWRPAGGVEPFVSQDRKSTRLNSSHSQISYAGFCLKKKTA